MFLGRFVGSRVHAAQRTESGASKVGEALLRDDLTGSRALSVLNKEASKIVFWACENRSLALPLQP